MKYEIDESIKKKILKLWMKDLSAYKKKRTISNIFYATSALILFFKNAGEGIARALRRENQVHHRPYLYHELYGETLCDGHSAPAQSGSQTSNYRKGKSAQLLYSMQEMEDGGMLL